MKFPNWSTPPQYVIPQFITSTATPLSSTIKPPGSSTYFKPDFVVQIGLCRERRDLVGPDASSAARSTADRATEGSGARGGAPGRGLGWLSPTKFLANRGS